MNGPSPRVSADGMVRGIDQADLAITVSDILTLQSHVTFYIILQKRGIIKDSMTLRNLGLYILRRP
jgi:hypothetical protein